MARRKDLNLLRNAAICKKYKSMASAKNDSGIPKYNIDFILDELEKKYFFLDTKTLWFIIMNEPERGYLGNEPKKQLEMFSTQ